MKLGLECIQKGPEDSKTVSIFFAARLERRKAARNILDPDWQNITVISTKSSMIVLGCGQVQTQEVPARDNGTV